jgi:hypothetical protein
MDDWRTNLLEDDDGVAAVLRETRRIAVLGMKTEAQSGQPAFYVPEGRISRSRCVSGRADGGWGASACRGAGWRRWSPTGAPRRTGCYMGARRTGAAGKRRPERGEPRSGERNERLARLPAANGIFRSGR